MLKDPKLSCSVVRERLPLLVGGELEASASILVREHLARCFECSRELGSHLGARRALLTARGDSESLGGDEARFFADLQGAILGRVEAAGVQGPLVRVGWMACLLRKRRAALGMAALFMIGLGLVHLGRSVQVAEPKLLGNGPLAVPARFGAPLVGTPEVLENLSRRSLTPRPAGLPRFGLQARQDRGRWLEVATDRRHPVENPASMPSQLGVPR